MKMNFDVQKIIENSKRSLCAAAHPLVAPLPLLVQSGFDAMLAARLRSVTSSGALIAPARSSPPRAARAPAAAVTAAAAAAAPSEAHAGERELAGGPARRRPRRAVTKPFLVRVAGRTSDVKAAAGAVVKRLEGGAVRRSSRDDAQALRCRGPHACRQTRAAPHCAPAGCTVRCRRRCSRSCGSQPSMMARCARRSSC